MHQGFKKQQNTCYSSKGFNIFMKLHAYFHQIFSQFVTYKEIDNSSTIAQKDLKLLKVNTPQNILTNSRYVLCNGSEIEVGKKLENILSFITHQKPVHVVKTKFLFFNLCRFDLFHKFGTNKNRQNTMTNLISAEMRVLYYNSTNFKTFV